MLIHRITTTPNGATWVDARACEPAMPGGMSHRHAAAVSGGFYGINGSFGSVLNGTTKRPEGLRGGSG